MIKADNRYWLFKSEPSVFGVDDFKPNRPEPWEGIRNYQARNLLRDQVTVGDLVFLYHSSCAKPAITGIMRVVRGAYPDPFQFRKSSRYYDEKSSKSDPRWLCVDVILVKKMSPIFLQDLKKIKKLDGMMLLKKGCRLSIQPVNPKEWNKILSLSESA